MTELGAGSSRYRHYALDLKKYYRMPAVQASLSTVLSLFITTFFILAAIRPTILTITTLNRTIEDTDKTLKQLKVKEKAIQQAAGTWEQVKEFVPFVDTSIPINGPGYNMFIKSVEYLGLQNQVEISSETVGSALLFSDLVQPYKGKGREVIEMPLSIRVAGSYENVMGFYTQLIKMDRIVNIESLSLNNDTSVKNKGSLVSLSIAGSISYLGDTKTLDTVLGTKDKN